MIENKEGSWRGGVARGFKDSIRLSALGTGACMCVFTGDECCGGTKFMVAVVTAGGGPQAV